MPQLNLAALAFWMLLTALVADRTVCAQDHAGNYPPVDIQNGALLFGANCAQCHGVNGDTVPGVTLKTGTFRHAATDEDLARLLTTGIPGTAMPATRLSPPEADALVAYL